MGIYYFLAISLLKGLRTPRGLPTHRPSAAFSFARNAHVLSQVSPVWRLPGLVWDLSDLPEFFNNLSGIRLYLSYEIKPGFEGFIPRFPPCGADEGPGILTNELCGLHLAQ